MQCSKDFNYSSSCEHLQKEPQSSYVQRLLCVRVWYISYALKITASNQKENQREVQTPKVTIVNNNWRQYTGSNLDSE